MKIIIALAFVVIIASLASALIFMMRGSREDGAGNKRMAWALTVRIGISVLVFLCILIAWKLGYIQPTGLPASR